MKRILASLMLVGCLFVPSSAQTSAVGSTRYSALHIADFEGQTRASLDEIRAIATQHLQEVAKTGEKETVYIVEVKVIEELSN